MARTSQNQISFGTAGRSPRPRAIRKVHLLLEPLEERSLLAITVQPALPWSIQEGNTLSGFVAHFTDSNTETDPEGYSATIDWGDGTSTDVDSIYDIVGEAGGFSVNGSHQYSDEGSYEIKL